MPCGPIRFAEELIDDEQLSANQMIVELNHDLSGPQRQVGPLLQMSATPLEAQTSSPPLGRDTEAILRSAGYSEAEITELRANGIIN